MMETSRSRKRPQRQPTECGEFLDAVEARIWLGSLEVAPEESGSGSRTTLVGVLERAAYATCVKAIRLFSRRTTAEFSQRLGYDPESDPRYLCKTIKKSFPS